MFDHLMKAVVGAVALPFDIAADVITMGGACTDQDEPYTARRIRQIGKNLDRATTSEGDADV